MLKNLRVGTRIKLFNLLMVVMLMVVGGMGIYGMSSTVERLDYVKSGLLEPSEDLSTARYALQGINLELLRALQHDPGHALVSLHNHKVDLHVGRLDKMIKQFEESWSAFTDRPRADEEEARLVDEFDASLATIIPMLRKSIEGLRNDDYSMAIHQQFLVQGQSFMMSKLPLLEQLATHEVLLGQKVVDQSRSQYLSQTRILLGVIFAALVIGFVMNGALAESIKRPLDQMIDVTGKISAGELNHALPSNSRNDEFSDLVISIGSMQDNLRHVMHDLQSASGELSSASVQLNASAHSVSSASSEQSASANSMTASVEEMTHSINLVADSAKEAATLAKQAGTSSEEGSAIIHQTVDRMHEIADNIGQATEKMRNLRDRAEDISRVIGVIREVADQTNLLALNAAIEAARAGEQGRGFAVVADEVRKLAERTAGSTTEIGKLINSIQDSVGDVFDVMASSHQHATEGLNVANQAGAAVKEITSKAKAVDDVVQMISSALDEQQSVAADIAGNVDRIAMMIETNANASRDTSLAASGLQTLAERIDQRLKSFKT